MCLTLSSMIQSKVMNRRSKVTKRQKVLLTSEMHFFSPASYDSTLAQMGVVFIDPTPLPVSRESALLLHRLSIAGRAPPGQGWAPPSRRPPVDAQKVDSGLRGGESSERENQAGVVDVDSVCGGKLHHCICKKQVSFQNKIRPTLICIFSPDVSQSVALSSKPTGSYRRRKYLKTPHKYTILFLKTQ